jgi:hypothetical protein
VKRERPSKSDESEIDVPAIPNFTNFEEGNVWLADRLGEDYVRKCGRWELYKRSQQISGFEEAQLSWAKAWAEFLRRDGNPEIASGQINPEKSFFYLLKRRPSSALQVGEPLISAAARRGDIGFFKSIVSAINRGGPKKRHSYVAFQMLYNWLHGFLWLMPDIWGSKYLEGLIERPLSQENYEKHRQRLSLVGWEIAHKHPLIEGYNPKTGAFTFRKGWTNLNPDLSR